MEKHETPLKPAGSNTTISWGSLPPHLAKLGKEVLQYKDSALVAAAEALQEACAAQTFLQCLSTFSELQCTKDDDPQSRVVRLLDLHENIVRARLITRSLDTISPVRTDTNLTTPGSIKEAVKLTSERKKCAVSWIKQALACDLSHFPHPVKSTDDSEDTTKTANPLNPSRRQFNKLNDTCGIPKQRMNSELQFGLAMEKEHPIDWVKGSSVHVCIDLDNALQGECKKCFLSYVEEFLDGIISQRISTASDSELASVMCQIKRVDDWLGVIMGRDGSPKDDCSEDASCEDVEHQTCQRLRKKLYFVLLKHVERSAFALENLSTEVATLRN